MSDFYAQLEQQLVAAGRRRDGQGDAQRMLAGRGWRLAAAGALAAAIAAAVVVFVAPLQRDAVQRSPAAPAAPAVPVPAVATDLSGIRVAVLNGTTQPGVARATAAQLRSRHARIVAVGNAPRQHVATTEVRHRHGARAKALRVAAVLGVARVGLGTGSLPNVGHAEVIVLVGADRQGGPRLESPPRAPVRPAPTPRAPETFTP